jgi:hypothetical protein
VSLFTETFVSCRVGFAGAGCAGGRRNSGTLQVICTFTKITGNGAWEVCAGAALLPGGQITISGSIPQGAVFEVPVVGGTGAYAGARGYARAKDIRGENPSKSAATIVITG